MSEAEVLTEVDGNVLIVTINRPEARNALTSEMLARIPQLMVDAEADDDVDVIIIIGRVYGRGVSDAHGSIGCVGAHIGSSAGRESGGRVVIE